jgi:hypothetical protein
VQKSRHLLNFSVLKFRLPVVMPAHAGIHLRGCFADANMASRLPGNDGPPLKFDRKRCRLCIVPTYEEDR